MIYKEFAVLLFIITFSLLYYGLKKLKPIYFALIEGMINEFYGLLLVQSIHLFVLDSLFIQLIIIVLLDFLWFIISELEIATKAYSLK